MAASPKDRTSNLTTRNKSTGGDQKKKSPKNSAASPNMASFAKRVLPVMSVILAFVGMIMLYRHVFPWIAAAPEAESEEQAVVEDTPAEPSYKGVEDPWVESGLFSMGDLELDAQIKAFCDALSVEGSSAQQNAQFVYDAIVWSAYEERTAEQKPAGRDWDVALMRHYLSTGNPEQGEGGSGDAYEFAAATSYCLQYFGFSDAIAVPVLKTDDNGNEVGSAVVLVTNTDGERCVCDPSLSGDGWMIGLDRYDSIVVEDIGQDLKAVEKLGFKIKQSEQPTQPPEAEEQYASAEGFSQEEAPEESSEEMPEETSEEMPEETIGQEEQGSESYEATDYESGGYDESSDYGY